MFTAIIGILLIAAAAASAGFAGAKAAQKKKQKSLEKALPAPGKAAPVNKVKAVKDAPKNAARLLRAYYDDGGRNKDKIAAYQTHMGRIAADGMVGPKTRARYKDLVGKSWPAPTTPVQKAKAASDAPKNAANLLRDYYDQGGRDKDRIRAYQLHMGRLAIDGVVGPKTRARYKELTGKFWPEPSAIPPPPKEKGPIESFLETMTQYGSKQAPTPEGEIQAERESRPAQSTGPLAAAKKPKPAARPAARPAPPAAPRPAAKPLSAAAQAANELDRYILSGGRARATIAAYQRRMGKLDPDGLAGEGVKDRAQSLLSRRVIWPPSMTFSGPAPAPSEPKAAANELADYLQVYHGTRKERIAAYQKVMDLVADGIVGPKTRARVFELSGRKI